MENYGFLYGTSPCFAMDFQVAQNWQTDDLIHCRLRAAGARQVVLQPPCVTVHQNHRRHSGGAELW